MQLRNVALAVDAAGPHAEIPAEISAEEAEAKAEAEAAVPRGVNDVVGAVLNEPGFNLRGLKSDACVTPGSDCPPFPV